MDFWWSWQFKRSTVAVSGLRSTVGLSNVHRSVHSYNMGHSTTVTLHFYILEYSHVGLVSIKS